MKPTRIAALLLALLLSLGTGIAQAQENDRPPTELWEEYPLGSPTEQSSQPSAQNQEGGDAQPAAPVAEETGGGPTSILPFLVLGLLTLAAVTALALRGRARRKAAPAARQPRGPEPASPPPNPVPAQSPATEPVVASAPTPAAGPDTVYALGYTTFAAGQGPSGAETQQIGHRLEEACEERGMVLKKLVGDVESAARAELRRPGLLHAQDLLASNEAHCLVVESLDQLSRSAGSLGVLVSWLAEHDARFVVVDIDLDTSTPEGRLAADALVTVGALERQRLDQRTRKGLEAAREGRRASGRPAVADKPTLKRRIAEMRADGMTLQAIADALNAEGVPTLRGGAEWRPSSVQAAAGYKRPSPRSRSNGEPN